MVSNYLLRARDAPGTVTALVVRKIAVHNNIKAVVLLKYILEWKFQTLVKHNNDTI